MFCTKLEKISADIISTTASGHARCRYVERRRRIPLISVIGLYQCIDESTDTVQVQNSAKGIFGIPVCQLHSNTVYRPRHVLLPGSIKRLQ